MMMKQKRQKTGILEWLELRESFQIETDLPLDECVLRLNMMQNTLRKFSLEHPYKIVPVRQLQDRLFSMQLSGPGRGFFSVYVKIILWSENGVNVISGETQVEGLDGFVFMYLTAFIFSGLLTFSSFPSCFWVFALVLPTLTILPGGYTTYINTKNIRVKFICYLHEILSNDSKIDCAPKIQN